MNYCSCCHQTQGIHGCVGPMPMGYLNQHQDSTTAYNNAWYHYQSYLYYLNLHNAQYSQGSHSQNGSLCECYEDRRQSPGNPSFGQPTGYMCTDCPDGSDYRTTGHSCPREFQTFNEASGDVEFKEDSHDKEFDCDNDGDDDDEIEVDEGFYQFLKQSEKHREEREKTKRELAKADEYVEAGKRQITASTLPPEEHQEAKRKKAMDTLYGDRASFIMSLEASLQLHYDRNFDEKQPIFWPNIPLKF